MSRIGNRDRSRWIWLAQAASGAALLGLLALHMVANHFVVAGGIRGYADVVRYLSHPAVLPFEVLFLLVVTSHALLGVRAVILDLGLSANEERRLNRLLAAVGGAMIAYGLWLTGVIVSHAGVLP
jgi:succinate dehydrogenase hydrophobic anchor subunit